MNSSYYKERSFNDCGKVYFLKRSPKITKIKLLQFNKIDNRLQHASIVSNHTRHHSTVR